jgi:hypothetical protein
MNTGTQLTIATLASRQARHSGAPPVRTHRQVAINTSARDLERLGNVTGSASDGETPHHQRNRM